MGGLYRIGEFAERVGYEKVIKDELAGGAR
jgi:hypothetical protein